MSDDDMSQFRQWNRREVQYATLLAAARLVVNCWHEAPDAGGLPVALDELRDAVSRCEKMQ